MKHFHIPFVTRNTHDNEIEKLKAEIKNLTEQLSTAHSEIKQFKQAQIGNCAISARCKKCNHCLEHIEVYGIGTRYESYECDLILPQCQHYSPKE